LFLSPSPHRRKLFLCIKMRRWLRQLDLLVAGQSKRLTCMPGAADMSRRTRCPRPWRTSCSRADCPSMPPGRRRDPARRLPRPVSQGQSAGRLRGRLCMSGVFCFFHNGQGHVRRRAISTIFMAYVMCWGWQDPKRFCAESTSDSRSGALSGSMSQSSSRMRLGRPSAAATWRSRTCVG
jgi:hypothetical protein